MYDLDSEDFVTVTFHVEKEMKSPSKYFFDLYLYNIESGTSEYTIKNIFKYSEISVDIDTWTLFFKPINRFCIRSR